MESGTNLQPLEGSVLQTQAQMTHFRVYACVASKASLCWYKHCEKQI